MLAYLCLRSFNLCVNFGFSFSLKPFSFTVVFLKRKGMRLHVVKSIYYNFFFFCVRSFGNASNK